MWRSQVLTWNLGDIPDFPQILRSGHTKNNLLCYFLLCKVMPDPIHEQGIGNQKVNTALVSMASNYTLHPHQVCDLQVRVSHSITYQGVSHGMFIKSVQ